MSSQHYSQTSQLGKNLPDVSILVRHSHQQQQPPYPNEEVDHLADVSGLMRTRYAIDLAVHGIIGFLSVYAFGSIISAMQFQSTQGYTSSTAVFLFLATGISFVMAATYFGLAWWARSPRGMEQIRSYFQQRDMSEEAVTKQSPSSPSWTSRIAVFLVSNRLRLWIQAVLMVLCLLTATLQACKIRGVSNCSAVPAQYHHFCSTTNAAVASTFLTGFSWMAWLSWLIYKTRGAFVSVSNRMSEEVQRGDILISMPDERRLANMTEVSGGVSRGSIGPLLNQPENNQSQVYMPPPLTQSEKSQQHTTPAMTPMNPSTNNSFGLGIDICTKNASNHAPTKGENEDAGISSAGPNTDMPNSASSNKSTLDRNRGSLNRSHQNGVSLSGINHISNINAAASNAPARSRSNSIRSNQSTSNINGRLRDHAKVFPMSRSRASSIHEAYSNRGTPLLRSASREFAPGSAYSLHRVNGSFSSVVSTPTTPLSRGEMGYMGAHTIKALQNFPRSVSMGHIAAFNNAMAGPAGASTHASPVIGAGSGMPSGGFEPSGTPISVRSQSMSNFFSSGPLGGYHPQTPAEAEAAEQSMDEHLRAIRRRSVAAEVMNSPGDINSTENPVFATEGAASPAMSSRAGSFRMSFSSPNLSSYRRRSSLGLKSVLNSILPSSARSSSSSSISSSEASSPCSATSPQESDSAYSADGRSSFEAHSKQQQTVSAQELLRAEYGDLYPNRPDTEQTSDSDQASVNGARNLAAPGASRPRSASVSSDSTTKTTSSAHSDSTSSTISNMTSLSSEERRAARAAGPPRAFLNRLKIGHQRKGSQQQQQKHAQGKGSNGSINEITVMIPAQSHRSENSTPVSKKFPSNGDLGQFSWDYRREMPID